MQALVMSCDKLLYACVIEICCQFVEPVFNSLLHLFIATHACSAQKLLQVCEQVKITCSQVQAVGWVGKISQAKSASMLCTNSLYFLDNPRF
jgi:hypothetical protein